MQLPIEKWAEAVSLPSESQVALREASMCYRAGAYRSALLFSYVAWGLTLRSRILAAKCPPNFPAAKWNDIGGKLRNEDHWDAEVFDATPRDKPAPIFGVTPDLRAQVQYWKDRRNDCAHSKRNPILAAHVESLWEFLRSHLDKFVVGGSVEDLIGQVRDHFDHDLTAPGASCDALARAISTTIPTAERDRFFASVARIFRISSDTEAWWVPESASFFEAVLRTGASDVVDDAKRFLLTNVPAFAQVLRVHPQLVWTLSDAPQQIVRRVWRTELAAMGRDATALYAALLRNSLIPASEVAEACCSPQTRPSAVSSKRPSPASN